MTTDSQSHQLSQCCADVLLRHKTHLARVWLKNTCFSHHRDGQKLSKGLLKNIQCCHTFTDAEMQTQTSLTGLATVSPSPPDIKNPGIEHIM